MSGTRQLCTFVIAGQLFGVDVGSVQEIIRDQAITRIPLAPDAVAGLINLRGQIVPIIDVRRCLELPPVSPETECSNVVLATDAGAVSLRVDAIGDVVEVANDHFETPPDNLRGTTRRLIQGVYKLERELLLVLAIDVAIEVAVSSGIHRDGAGAGIEVSA